MDAPRFHDAVAPDRTDYIQTKSARLRVYEWGAVDAKPLVMCHGFIDHGRGFDRLAPLLAADHRVIALDSRGHGESSWHDNYLWPHDVRDTAEVLRHYSGGHGQHDRCHLLGHSRGGGQAIEAAILAPEQVDKLINLDGFGPPDDEEGFRPIGSPPMAGLSTPERCARFFEMRRRAHERTAWRPYDSFEKIVARRGEQNPNLDKDWLRYFVYHGATESAEGWRWKADPMMVAGGFGPFRPSWIAPNWQRLQCTMLALIGSMDDTWGPLAESELGPRLAYVPKLERATIEGSGHFIHMERPAETAAVVLDFLGRP
jgi:pimeloyl-ACP methyl ester carboxylesterase